MAALELQFRILGPLEVVGPEGPIAVASGRQRAILALLVLAHGSTVSSERLIDEIWGERPPATARHALTVHVAGLRRAIGADRIEATPGGYRLRDDAGEIDLVRFEALTDRALSSFEAGEPAHAADGYATALALWRGPALADLASEGVARSARARLDARRTRVTELWLDAEMAAGRHADLVPALRRLVAEEPLREGPQARLMVALYRSGRQAEALAVYHSARELLDRELGVEPGPELEAVQQAVLAHDPQLNWAGVDGPQIPVTRPGSARVSDQGGTATIESQASAGRVLRADDDDGSARSVPAEPGPVQARPMRRTVTALVAEISGPAALGAPDPESELQLGAREVAAMARSVAHHGGAFEPLVGSAVLAMFGIPVAHEDDALRAVRAALEMREVVVTLGKGESLVGLHIGIATGEIVIDATSNSLRLIAGDIVNIASSLARRAASGEILLGEATRDLIRHAAVAVAVDPVAQRDAAHPLAAYRLGEGPIGGGGHRLRLDSPLVGRQRELGQLQAAIQQATDDEACALFTLLGPAGVGKSRLVHEFLASIRPEVLVLRGRCLPYGEQAAFWPIAEIVRQAAGIDERDDPLVGRQKIERLLEGDARSAVLAERVASAIGLADLPSAVEETGWAIRALLEHLARARPLVVVFDDLQWADPAFLDLVEFIADSSRDVPILLLCIARPELLDVRPAWGGGKLNATSVLLRPLNEGDVSLLLVNLLGGSHPSTSISRTIAEAAEGNPLFVEEFLAMLIDDGTVRREGPDWVPAADLSTVAIPGSIMALLSARLDRLPLPERHVLEQAAVVGKVFSRDALEGLADASEAAGLEASLAALARREIIRVDRQGAAGTQSFRFKHALIRDAAYAGMPKRARIVLHERLATWLAEASRDQDGLNDEIIGAHLEQAYRYLTDLGARDESTLAIGRRAATRLSDAGRRARIRGMATVAEGLLERALALLSSRDPGRLTLLVDLTGAYITSGAFRAARRSNDELLREAVSSGLEDVRWRAMLDKVRLDWYMQSEGTPTVDVAMEAISFFEARGDDQALGMAWRLVASVEMGDGHMANARVAYERAADHAARALDLHGQADARNNIAGVDMIGPATVSAAMRTAVALLDWGRTTGQPVTEAIGLAHLGRLTAMLGDFDEARRLVDAAIEINRDLGQALHEAHSFSRWIGTVEWLAGDPEAAERALRRGYEALGRLGAPGGRAFVGTQLARMLYLLGRYDEAYECTVVAEAYGGVFEIATSVEWRSVRGLVLARRGQADAAVGLAREAVAIIAPTDLLWAHGVALEDLADVLELSGRTFEARPYLAQARALYEQKGITVLAERVRARLEG